MSQYKLFREIIALSKSNDWDVAVREWRPDYTIVLEKAEETCLCGHYPIKECCYIENILNNNKIMVGNCCIKKFFPDLDVQFYFKGIRSCKKGSIPNYKFREYCLANKWINGWEFKFLQDRFRKKNASPKQEECKANILYKIIKKNEGQL